MKVVYVSIGKRIRDAIRFADERNRRIEKIEVTAQEMAELRAELALLTYPDPAVGNFSYYMGVRLEIV